jgi:hypothetical protein
MLFAADLRDRDEFGPVISFAQFKSGKLVRGPGFEPGASRSRITVQLVQTCPCLANSIPNFLPSNARRLDLERSSFELRHKVLRMPAHPAATQIQLISQRSKSRRLIEVADFSR